MPDRVALILRGTGFLILADDQELPLGAFRIEQNYSGRTFLYCARTDRLAFNLALMKPVGLRGQTSDGHSIKAHWGALEYFHEPRGQVCIAIRNVEIGERRPDGRVHVLLLTNFEFPNEKAKSTTLDVHWGNSCVQVRLTPHRDYQKRLGYLLKTHGITPTAVLRFNSKSLPDADVDRFIIDLCLALSVLHGRKVNWIHRATHGPHREFQHAVFGHTVTKSPKVPPLCLNPTRTFVTLPPTAVQNAIPAIKHFRETFDANNLLINAWLDGRTEADYLEARTLKCVVVVEALVTLTTRREKIERNIHPSASWKDLYRRLSEALPGEFAASVTKNNWNRLNEKPFRALFSEVCERHRITVSADDLSVFSRIRNSIVHRFDYDPDISVPPEWDLPGQRHAAVHFFAAAFVDRIVLQLCGLHGELPN